MMHSIGEPGDPTAESGAYATNDAESQIMKLLVIFGAWSKNDSENSQRWMNWYRDILDEQFADCDKFVAISHEARGLINVRYHDLPNLLGLERVDARRHINSDASQFQLALRRCKEVIPNYDYVLFIHSKGASYDFGAFDPWRASVRQTIFNRDVLEQHASAGTRIIAERGYMGHAVQGIVRLQALLHDIGIADTAFHFAAATTLYCVPAKALSELLDILPPELLTENLQEIGYNRFFFESTFPSLFTSVNVEPTFVGGARFNPALNQEVSYDADPLHCSALVLREYNRRREQGSSYRPVPIPYVFGGFTDLTRTGVHIEFQV